MLLSINYFILIIKVYLYGLEKEEYNFEKKSAHSVLCFIFDSYRIYSSCFFYGLE